MSPQDPPFDELLRSAAPTPPEGLAERVLATVREAALARVRFRGELERSARGSLIAAAAGLLACAALFLGADEQRPATAILRSQTLRSQTLRSQTLRSQTLRSQTLRSQTLRSQTLRSQTLRSQILLSPSATLQASSTRPDASGGGEFDLIDFSDLDLEEDADDVQALTISAPPGVLEGELTSGLWLFAAEEE